MQPENQMKIIPYMAFACLLGALMGFLVGHRSAQASDQDYMLKFDNNADGSPDAEFYHKKGVVVRAQHDRNFDGKWDYFEWYDEGVLNKAESDDNFDGKVDGWMTYKSGNLDQSKHDLDGNGEPDVINKYRHGVVRAAVCRPNGATNSVRIEFYRNGVPEKEYRDVDGDGLLEALMTYDQFGNEARQEKLTPALAPNQLKSD
jgi:antitoxin component YwqK of YwqJK toxin-antitoxin module